LESIPGLHKRLKIRARTESHETGRNPRRLVLFLSATQLTLTSQQEKIGEKENKRMKNVEGAKSFEHMNMWRKGGNGTTPAHSPGVQMFKGTV
jgi:hypothetical protein